MASEAPGSTSRVSGRIALVTGGARGLGVEICRGLGDLDAHVIVAARDLAKAEDVAAELRSQGHQTSSLKLDVTSEDDRRVAYDRIERSFGRLDILINNAGILLDSPDAGMPATREPSAALPAEVRQTFEVNFFAPLFLMQTLLPLLKRSDAPRIVNVSSMRGSLTHQSDAASPVHQMRALGYDTSKAALNSATILLAEELRGTSIKINSVHPGWLRTTMGGDRADMSIAEGARTVINYATLGEDGPTGGFFFLEERLPW